jgi:hypothetical protein
MKDSVTEIRNSLDHIRSILDADIIDSPIDEQKNKLLKLTQLIGLSAEAKASAKKILHHKELSELSQIEFTKISPSIASKMVAAECYEELALLEYADRLNSALVHSIDAIRSVISLYKIELENSLKG